MPGVIFSLLSTLENDEYLQYNYHEEFSLYNYLKNYKSLFRESGPAKAVSGQTVIESGFISGFFPGFSTPEYDLARSTIVATFMTWCFMPILLMNYDFDSEVSDSFYKNRKFLSFIFFVSDFIVSENPTLLKNLSKYKENPEFGRDIYGEIAPYFKEFLGMESKRSVFFMREMEKKFGKEFAENIKKTAYFYFDITNPMDVRTNNGLGLGTVYLANEVFTDYSQDVYYVSAMESK